MSFILVGVLSLYILYEYVTVTGLIDLPFISVMLENNIIVILNYTALNWSLVIGFVGLLYAISGYVVFKMEKSTVYNISMVIFYLFVSLIITL